MPRPPKEATEEHASRCLTRLSRRIGGTAVIVEHVVVVADADGAGIIEAAVGPAEAGVAEIVEDGVVGADSDGAGEADIADQGVFDEDGIAAEGE